jgi:carbonic anhydrase
VTRVAPPPGPVAGPRPAGDTADMTDTAKPPDGQSDPTAALAALVAGNQRFATGRPRYGHHVSAAAAASGAQRPYAVVVGCIDSRVPLEAVFDQDFGSICVVRSGGHVLDRAVLGSIEFAVGDLGAPLVVVLGHERCGAVASAVEAHRAGTRPAGNVAYLVREIVPAVAGAGPDDAGLPARAMRAHVARTVRRLLRVPSLRDGARTGRVAVAGAVYDLDTGRVTLV